MCRWEESIGIRGGAYAHSATARGCPFGPALQSQSLKTLVVFEVALQGVRLRDELEIHRDPDLRCQEPEGKTFWVAHGYWREDDTSVWVQKLLSWGISRISQTMSLYWPFQWKGRAHAWGEEGRQSLYPYVYFSLKKVVSSILSYLECSMALSQGPDPSHVTPREPPSQQRVPQQLCSSIAAQLPTLLPPWLGLSPISREGPVPWDRLSLAGMVGWGLQPGPALLHPAACTPLHPEQHPNPG